MSGWPSKRTPYMSYTSRSDQLAARQTVLILYAGILSRYDQVDFLNRLRDQVGRRDGIPGLWVLIPADEPRQRCWQNVAAPRHSPQRDRAGSSMQ